VTDALVAMPVERAPLAAPADGEDPLAPPPEPLHAVREPRNTPTRLPALAGGRERSSPPRKCPQEALARDTPAGAHPLAPGPPRTRGPRRRVVACAPCRQVCPQVVGRLARGRAGAHPLTPLPRPPLECRRPLAKRPPRPRALGRRGVGPRAGEPRALLRASRVRAVAGGPRHLEPREDELGPWPLRCERAAAACRQLRARARVRRRCAGLERRTAATVAC
jgi:hypothetical protein